jgi:hypothetical protein
MKPATLKIQKLPIVAEQKKGLSLKGSEGKTYSQPKPPAKSKKESSLKIQPVKSISEVPSGTIESKINY